MGLNSLERKEGERKRESEVSRIKKIMGGGEKRAKEDLPSRIMISTGPSVRGGTNVPALWKRVWRTRGKLPILWEEPLFTGRSRQNCRSISLLWVGVFVFRRPSETQGKGLVLHFN